MSRALLWSTVLISSAIISFAQPSLADMAPSPQVSTKKIVSHLEEKRSKKELSSSDTGILLMAKIAQICLGLDVTDVEDFRGPYPDAEKFDVASVETQLKSLKPESFASGIQRAIFAKQNWDQPVSESAKYLITKNREFLKITLKNYPLSWSWFLIQMDEEAEAKTVLSKAFQSAYERTMSLTSIEGLSHAPPLTYVTRLNKALEPYSSASEKSEREKKLKKMKIHMSAIPDNSFMT